jgi:hypothetical protein
MAVISQAFTMETQILVTNNRKTKKGKDRKGGGERQ